MYFPRRCLERRESQILLVDACQGGGGFFSRHGVGSDGGIEARESRVWLHRPSLILAVVGRRLRYLALTARKFFAREVIASAACYGLHNFSTVHRIRTFINTITFFRTWQDKDQCSSAHTRFFFAVGTMLSHVSDRDGGLVVGGWTVFLRDLGLSMESAEPGEGVTLGFICCGKRCLPDMLGGALGKGHENWVVVFP